MADLIITLPKSTKWTEYEKELAAVRDGTSVMNFRVPTAPRRAKAGDRCYLVHDGAVRGYMTIHDVVERDGFTCDTTGVMWEAGWYVQRTGEFFPMQPPLPMRGFQSFRYAPDAWRQGGAA